MSPLERPHIGRAEHATGFAQRPRQVIEGIEEPAFGVAPLTVRRLLVSALLGLLAGDLLALWLVG